MAKGLLAVVAAFLVAVVVAKGAYLQKTDYGDDTPNRAWAKSRMEFVAWNNEKWTAWVNGNNFEKLPQNTGKWHRHANTTLAFIDWDGSHWQAKIDDDEFLLARNGDWQGEVLRSDAIRYRDWSGARQIRSVAQLRR